MVCKNCGAKLKGNPDKCPLCDFVLNENKVQPKTKRKKGVGAYKNPFTLIYIFTAVAVVISLLLVCYFLKLDHSLWIGSFIGIIFIFFVIRHTFLGFRNYASKLSYLSIALCILMIILFEVTGYYNGFVFIYLIIQSLLFVDTVCLVFSDFKVYKPYISGFISQTIFAWVPLIIALVYKLNFIAPLVVALTQTVFTLVLICVFPKEIASQIKRFFTA